MQAIETCCQMLTDNAAASRPCYHVRPSLRRTEHRGRVNLITFQ
jgi:plasmid stabilization system protein ParE